MAAGRRHYEVGPEESGYIYPIRALERPLVFALVEVVPKGSEMHPARMIRIESHRTANDRSASLKLAGVHDLESQDPDRIGVEWVESHRALRRWTERREVLAEEVRLRQRHHRELVCPI